MKTLIITLSLVLSLFAVPSFAGDFGDCSLTCEEQAKNACHGDGGVYDYVCYGAAFWGCMAGCTSVEDAQEMYLYENDDADQECLDGCNDKDGDDKRKCIFNCIYPDDF
jgi:hypothetical protein